MRIRGLIRKLRLSRLAIVCLVIIVALASVGVTYARWTGQGGSGNKNPDTHSCDSGNGKGNGWWSNWWTGSWSFSWSGNNNGKKGPCDPVPTDPCDTEFIWVVSNDSGGVPENQGGYEPIDPGDDGGGTEYDYWGPASSDDPSAPQAAGSSSARYTKDVAKTTATLTGPLNIDVTVSNAYPSYYPTVFYGLKNKGGLPGTIQTIEVDEDASTPDVIDDIAELTVTVSGIQIYQVIDPGEEVIGELAIHVDQDAAQNAGVAGSGIPPYTIRVKITADCEEVEECGECLGKVTQLTLQYNGNETAYIKVKQKKDGNKTAIAFEGWVAPGATFTFNGKDKHGTLGPEISIYVNGNLNTTIHTSCSQPIGPGLVRGAFEVIEGYSREGGLLCPLPAP